MGDSDFLDRLVENLAAFLGSDCEIALHDFTHGYDSTIVKLINGHVSGRTVGCPPTNLFFEKVMGREGPISDVPVYFTKDNRRVFKSSTTFIFDKKRNVTGAVCINMDVTRLLLAQQNVCDFVGYDASENRGEQYAQSLNEIVEQYLQAAENEIGKPATEMNKSEKKRALAFLDSKGVFQIVKANVRLCEYFGISKFTLYSYLDEVRRNSRQDRESEQDGVLSGSDVDNGPSQMV